MLTLPHIDDADRMERHAVSAALRVSRNRILDRLHGDHETDLACATLLRRLISGPISGADPILIEPVIDKLADAPDDIHHVIEHMLFRRLRRRLGTPLMRRLDLDRLHEERRERRFAMLEARRDANGVMAGGARERSAILAFCDCVERHARIEERLLLPFARRFLLKDDWAETVETFDLCNDVLSAIRP